MRDWAAARCWSGPSRCSISCRSRTPRRRVNDYPHQFSGGMRQRVMIAMALSCRPKLLIADEPTTALDVTIQAQILDLLQDMKSRFGMSIMLITHAMGVVAEVAQRVVVMYAGKVVEEAPVGELFANPRHPYTQGLIRSIPRIDRAAVRKTRLSTIAGVVPRLIDPPARLPLRAALQFCHRRMPPRAACLARARSGPQGCLHPCGGDRLMSEAPTTREPLLRVSKLTKQFPLPGGLFGREAITLNAVDGVDFEIAPWRDAGAGRQVRLRQVDHRALRAAPDRTQFGRDQFRRQGCQAAGGRRTPHPAPRHPDHLPGPLCIVEPAHECRRHHRRGADHSPPDQDTAPVRGARGASCWRRSDCRPIT